MKPSKLLNKISGLFGSPGTLTPEEKAFVEEETRRERLRQLARRRAETTFQKIKRIGISLSIWFSVIVLSFLILKNAGVVQWFLKQFIEGAKLTIEGRIQDLETTPSNTIEKAFNDAIDARVKAWSEIMDASLVQWVGMSIWNRYLLEGMEGLRYGRSLTEITDSFLLDQMTPDGFERLSNQTKNHMLKIGREILKDNNATWPDVLRFYLTNQDNKEQLEKAFERDRGSIGTDFGEARTKAYREAHPMTAEDISRAVANNNYLNCLRRVTSDCSKEVKELNELSGGQ